MLKVGKGFICYCSQGKLGLVLSKKRVQVKYPNGKKGLAYTGIHLQEPDFGKPWSSRKPHIVGMIDTNNGNFKFPGEVKPVVLPNATLIKILQPHNYGIGIEEEEEQDEYADE